MKIHDSVTFKQIQLANTIWRYCVILSDVVIKIIVIFAHCFIENNVRIGNRVTIKNGVYIYDSVKIDDDVFIGPNVTFTNDITREVSETLKL